MTIKSSVAAGTSLKGLNFLKGKDDPVAMEDHEYPDWLWGILRDKKKEEDGVDLDIFCTSSRCFSFEMKSRRGEI